LRISKLPDGVVSASLRVGQPDLRVYQRVNPRKNVLEANRRDMSEPGNNLFRLRLNFLKLLNVRCKLSLLLNNKFHLPFQLFVGHSLSRVP
jgi:hypothetical protein